MNRQQQIERFTLAFHREAIRRLRDAPQLRLHALGVLDRWEAQGASAHGRYRDRWRDLLSGDVEQLEHAVCATTDEAATLRSVSPLGFVLDDTQRLALRRKAMAE